MTLNSVTGSFLTTYNTSYFIDQITPQKVQVQTFNTSGALESQSEVDILVYQNTLTGAKSGYPGVTGKIVATYTAISATSTGVYQQLIPASVFNLPAEYKIVAIVKDLTGPQPNNITQEIGSFQVSLASSADVKQLLPLLTYESLIDDHYAVWHGANLLGKDIKQLVDGSGIITLGTFMNTTIISDAVVIVKTADSSANSTLTATVKVVSTIIQNAVDCKTAGPVGANAVTTITAPPANWTVTFAAGTSIATISDNTAIEVLLLAASVD
jgi:hypothetical protein